MKLFSSALLALSLIFTSISAFADANCSNINTYGVAISSQQYINICRDGYDIGYNTQTKTPA